MSAARYEDAPKMAVGPGYFACPLCRRTVDRGGSAEGFRKAGLARHIWSCWEKTLTAAGLRVGSWSDKHNGHRILKARRATSGPEKP